MTSTTIYTSEKVLPYVYLCTHKTTNEFYIGYREANKLPSHRDFPNYKTSSKIVKPMFDEFDWVILAEFFRGDDAYDFEQSLILDRWNDPLILNKSVRAKGGKRFKTQKGHMQGVKRKPTSQETREKQRIIAINRTPEQKANFIGNRAGTKSSPETIQKLKDAKRPNDTPAQLAGRKRLSESSKGENHRRFSGYYITPWGKFASSYLAQNNQIDTSFYASSIRNMCKKGVLGFEFQPDMKSNTSGSRK